MLPYSMAWLLGILLANSFIRYQLNALNQQPFDAVNTSLALLCSYVAMALFMYIVLRGEALQARLLKTLMAYLGTEILFLTSTLILFRSPEDIANRFYLLMVLVIWTYAVKVSIIKQSLNAKAIVGVVLVITVEMLRVIPFVFFFLDRLVVKQGAM